MTRMARIALVALAVSGAPVNAQQSDARLVGTWRVVEFCSVDSPGDTTFSLGRQPIGHFIYGPAGTLSIQAMRTPPTGALAADSVPLSSMAELRDFYFGYFGTYTITSDTTVVHHVTGGTIPDYIGTAPPSANLR